MTSEKRSSISIINLKNVFENKDLDSWRGRDARSEVEGLSPGVGALRSLFGPGVWELEHHINKTLDDDIKADQPSPKANSNVEARGRKGTDFLDHPSEADLETNNDAISAEKPLQGVNNATNQKESKQNTEQTEAETKDELSLPDMENLEPRNRSYTETPPLDLRPPGKSVIDRPFLGEHLPYLEDKQKAEVVSQMEQTEQESESQLSETPESPQMPDKQLKDENGATTQNGSDESKPETPSSVSASASASGSTSVEAVDNDSSSATPMKVEELPVHISDKKRTSRFSWAEALELQDQAICRTDGRGQPLAVNTSNGIMVDPGSPQLVTHRDDTITHSEGDDFIKSLIGLHSGHQPGTIGRRDAKLLLSRAAVMETINHLSTPDEDEAGGIAMEGTVNLKCSGRWGTTSWKERYAVLHPHNLLIYKNSDATVPKDSISIHVMAAVSKPFEEKGKYSFELETKTGDHPMVLRTDTKSDCQNWVNELKKLLSVQKLQTAMRDQG